MFSVLFCWFVFNFCLESWNVLGKLFLRKFISNPPTLFRAPAYLSPLLLRQPASPCSSPVTTFFPSFQCPGEAGASRPRSVKSKSSGPPVKMASQAANPATLGKKQRESIFLCNGHPRRSLTIRGAFVSHQRGTKGNISFFSAFVSWCFFLSPFFLENQNKSISRESKHRFDLSQPLAFDFYALLHLPSTNASIIPWALLEFLWGS